MKYPISDVRLIGMPSPGIEIQLPACVTCFNVWGSRSRVSDFASKVQSSGLRVQVLVEVVALDR
jgi:hypothetical protein